MYTFLVQINKDITIEEFKEAIKKKIVILITLEMVEIPNNYGDMINYFRDILSGDELIATRYIKDY